MLWLVDWSKTRQPWLILFLTAFALVASALYFQHVQNYLPCIKCIYQRTAVIGILLAALLPLITPTLPLRLVGLGLWIYSASMGLITANEHIEVIYADSIFMPPCPVVPNFPEFLPLHDILPRIFDGPGDCADNSWQFLNLGMAEWMRIIFALYLLVGIAVAASYLIKFKHLRVKKLVSRV